MTYFLLPTLITVGGMIMLCECGCGRETNSYKGKFKKYIHGHNKSQLGRHRSDEQRQRNSELHKGLIPWNKGKKGLQVANSGSFYKGQTSWNKGSIGIMVSWNKGLTKETDERVAKLSKPHSLEWNQRISKALKGKIQGPLSEEWKLHISESNKKVIHTLEWNKKVAEAQTFPIGTEYYNKSLNRVLIKVEGGWMLRSRYVMEQTLGRKLESWEEVHHKDEDTMNDAPDNLQLFPSKSEHMKFHMQGE
jgi:hypothetical protein